MAGAAGAAGTLATRVLVPRLTSSHIRVAVPPTITTAPTTTKIFRALSRESDIIATGEPTVGPVELQAGTEHDGQRLDRFLAARLPQLSRSRLQTLVREGHLRQGERVIAEPGQRVKPGERFVLELPPLRPAEPAPERHALEILFEDEHLVVLVKPAGLVVHPAPGHAQGTLVNALLAHCAGSLSGIGGVERPGIVHRLDREVSGVMVAAKHDRAHVGLAGQFSVHTIDRVYEALVWGLPAVAEGTVDRPVGRHPTDRKRMAVVRQGGKRAVTHWRLLGAAGTRAAHLALRLETGRTHQIRVHTSSLGHPIIGDRLYGRGRDAQAPAAAAAIVGSLDRILLHARHLGFVHPITGEEMSFDVPPPAIFARVLELLRA
jgi:23S rRNA pseudouridine1911/1915/1917 synthase